MASVKNETPNQNRGHHEFESYNLSDMWCIEQLLKNRLKLDDVYKSQLFEDYNPFNASDIPTFTELIEVLYVDLEHLIKTCGLNDEEKLVVDKTMMGYTSKDIAELFLFCDNTYPASVLKRAVLKIKKRNDYTLLKWYERQGINIQKKMCTKCGGIKVISEFTRKKNTSDGLHPYCNECRNGGNK